MSSSPCLDTVAQRRIEALRSYDIMDTPPEKLYDDITRLTTFICGTPIATITLLDLDRQWFKSKVGLDSSETPIEHAFCNHAIRQENVFLVPDALEDERFRTNPFVTSEPHIRFYAGAPLVTPSGVAVGTLCAIDRVPRQFSEAQQEALSALARQVITQLELRRTMKQLGAALQEVRILQDLLPMCSWCRKVRNDQEYWCSLDDYLNKHSEVELSHSICPECQEKMTAEWDGNGSEQP